MVTWWRLYTWSISKYFRNFENCPNGSEELAVKSFVCPDTFTRIWSIRLIFINSYLIGIILFQARASFFLRRVKVQILHCRTSKLEGSNRNTFELEMTHYIDLKSSLVIFNLIKSRQLPYNTKMKPNKSQFHSSSPAVICHHPTSRYSHRMP